MENRLERIGALPEGNKRLPVSWTQYTNETIQIRKKTGRIDTNDISDGYHTFGELYEHRIELFIALCRVIPCEERECSVWRSKKHSDGIEWDGWFLLGINKTPGQQITYHLPISKWDQCSFVDELDQAPAWDGHTSQDVLDRLKEL